MSENISDKMLLEAAGEQASFRILYNRYWEPYTKKPFIVLETAMVLKMQYRKFL
jgi:hypothetical protein